uniref:Uncharacterized protein n=1 Tax=Hemiselmis tepida TaxID=464990 RepID=A0A7S0Z1S0_9CRYP
MFQDFSFNAQSMEEKFGNAAAASTLRLSSENHRQSPGTSPQMRSSAPKAVAKSPTAPLNMGQAAQERQPFEQLSYKTVGGAGGTIQEENDPTSPVLSPVGSPTEAH